MGPMLTLNWEQVQMINAARGRYLLEVYSKEETDAKYTQIYNSQLLIGDSVITELKLSSILLENQSEPGTYHAVKLRNNEDGIPEIYPEDSAS